MLFLSTYSVSLVNLSFPNVSQRLLLLAFSLVVLGNSLLWREIALQANGHLVVHFFDVGQGDATLLITPSGKQILIDGGPNMEVLERLGSFMPFFDRTIDMLVLTHPDTDHLTALPNIVQRYNIGAVLLAGTDKHTARYTELLEYIEQKQLPVVWAETSKKFIFSDGVSIEMLWPDINNVSEIKDANDASIVLRVQYNGASILCTGDIEEWAEKEILASGRSIQADVLKVPHHGSRTSSSTGFLLAVAPKLAIISAGADNRFGHPHPEVVQRYEKLDISVRNTALEGTISLEFE